MLWVATYIGHSMVSMKHRYTVKVRKDGKITIPKAIRENLGWHAGDLIEMTLLDNGTIVARKVNA